MLDPEIHGTAIQRFGEWAVTTNGVARADGGAHIPVPRLWDIWADGTNEKWGWPILALRKDWVKPEEVNDFNDAFFSALEQFKAFRPKLSGKPSSHATLELQQRLFPTQSS